MAFVKAINTKTAHDVTKSSLSHTNNHVIFNTKFKEIIKHTIRSNIGLKLYNLNPSLFFLNIVQITEKLEINILIFKIEIRLDRIKIKIRI